jgi:DNA-binding transcriptional regulator YiaG
MPRKPKFDLSNVRAMRRAAGLNQLAFWGPLGVTQSGGSRYESGRGLPPPVALLLWLRQAGRLTSKDLADAEQSLKKARPKNV